MTLSEMSGQLQSEKIACITLDLEQDYAGKLQSQRFEAFQHIPPLMDLLTSNHIPLTCYVQGNVLEGQSSSIEMMASHDVEFELHSYSHPPLPEINHEEEIGKGLDAYRDFFIRSPLGYRSCYGVTSQEMFRVLDHNGFKFDSSIVPSIRPGFYENLTTPLSPYRVENTGLFEFPVSVFSNLVRVPITLSHIKLLGRSFLFLIRAWHSPPLVIFYFHLHDLAAITSYNELKAGDNSLIHRLISTRIYQENGGMEVLREYIKILSDKGYKFARMNQIYKKYSRDGK